MSEEKKNKEALKWFMDKLSLVDDLTFTPCKFCGRVVLAGVCCQEALEEARANQANASEAVQSEVDEG